MIHKGSEIPIASPPTITDTDEDNGTRLEIAIKDGDAPHFQVACKTQLAYFPDVNFVNCGLPSNQDIIVGKHFAVRDMYGVPSLDELHLCIGHVAYPLDIHQITFEESYSNKLSKIAMGLRFSQDEFEDIDLMWNRESVEYTAKTKKSIARKFTAAIEGLQGIAAEESADYDNLADYFIATARYDDDSDFWLTKTLKVPGLRQYVSFGLPTYKELNLGKHDEHSFFDRFFRIRMVIDGRGRKTTSRLTVHSEIETMVAAIRDGYDIAWDDSGCIILVEPGFVVGKQITNEIASRLLTDHSKCILIERSSVQNWQATSHRATAAQYDIPAHDEFGNDLEIWLISHGLTNILEIKVDQEREKIEAEVRRDSMCTRWWRPCPISTSYEAMDLEASNYHSVEGSWKQENDYPMTKHLKFVEEGKLLIYGGMRDEDELFFAGVILETSPMKHYRVIKISSVNGAHMEFIGATHVRDFLMMNVPASRLIRREMTRSRIVCALRTLGVDYSMLSKIQEAFYNTGSEWEPIVDGIRGFIDGHSHKCKIYWPQYEFYQEWENHRKLLEKEAKAKSTPIPHMLPVEDEDMIQMFHDFGNLLDTFPLLQGMVMNPSQVPVDELRAYLTLKLKTVSLLRIINKRKPNESASNRSI